MAGIGQDTLWQFASMVFGKGKSEPTNREQATFLRTDSDGTQWVRLSGSSNETPVNGRTLASAKAGDVVEWSIEDGKLSIIGNATTPSVGSSYVDNEVKVVTRQVDAIRAEVVETAELVADKASIGQLEAESARISDLEADTADIDTIRANAAKVQNLTAAQLEADHATIGTLDTTYMHANMANADVAWINNGTIRDGAIVSAMINDVSANKLTAGTINGSVINVTNLNADNITAGTINGQRIGQGSLSLDKLSEDVYTESEVDTIVDGLNDRIDGAIETHTGTAVPTLNNSPASSWNTTALKDEHVGDVYYVVNSQSQQNGYCYRFTKSGSTYSWQLIKDSDVTAALSRLTTAEGKITSIESFDSTVSSFMTNTDSELTSVKSRATSLETRMTDAEGDISEKVDTSTFNTLSQTVDGNSSSITSMSTVLTNNGLTSSTNITNTVNTVSQTASGNSSKITQLTTTLGTNADGTTKAGDVVHRTSAIEQDVSSFKTTVSETYATQTALATTNGNVTAAQTAADNAATAASNAQTTANTANNKQVAFSATSSTGATTAAKVAACTNFPSLAAGVTVTVRFSTANTSSGAITLNVNSTGAKTVYVNGSATSSSNQLLWGANANITFTYDGSYWRVDSEPRTWYGTGGVAAATAAKTATINEVVICKGTTVVLNMTYENTSTSATLNVTSTGAKNIYYGTTTTRPTTANGYGWGAGSTVSLTFDGQYWRIGDTTALARLTAAESTISSHTTSISQNAEAIALKADSSTTYTKTDVDGLISTEVTNRNAAITTKANEITSSVSETYATKTAVNGKADASDVTALAGRVTTAESNITQNANNIALKVSESDVTGNYIVGKINLNSTTASIAAEHINLQGAVTISDLASDAQNATLNSNISVGGRNLLHGTANPIKSSTWGYDTWTVSSGGNGVGTIETVSDSPVAGVTKSFRITGNSSGNRDFGQYNKTIQQDLTGTYRFTAWVRGIGGSVDAYVRVWDSTSGKQTFAEFITATTSWTKVDINFDPDLANSPSVGNALSVRIGMTGSGSVEWIAPKLECGNKPTDWAPAPEDQTAYVDDSISSIQVGGRNLLQDSKFTTAFGAGWWVLDGLSATLSDNKLVIDGSVAATGNKRIYQSPARFSHVKNTTYTFSCDIVATAACQVSFGRRYGTVNNYGVTFDVTTTSQRISGTYTSTSTVGAFCISGVSNSATVTISNPKLEIGNKATDWTPSPEDVDSAISNAAKTATSYVTEITGQNGIMVHPSTDQTTGVRITSDVDILRNGNTVLNVGTQGDTSGNTDAGVTIYDGTANENVVATFAGDGIGLAGDAFHLTSTKTTSQSGVEHVTSEMAMDSANSNYKVSSYVSSDTYLSGQIGDLIGRMKIGLNTGDSTFFDVYEAPSINMYATADTSSLTAAADSVSVVADDQIELVSDQYVMEGVDGTTNTWSVPAGTVIWSSSGWAMAANVTATLSYPISSCPSGIVLHWQAYASNATQDYDHIYTFIPKQHVVVSNGKGVVCQLANGGFGFVGTKYVYVSNNGITGHSTNQATGTSNGITYNNGHWVLTQVIAV